MTLKEFNKKWLEGCNNFDEAEHKKVERYKEKKRKQLKKNNCKNIDDELNFAVMKYAINLSKRYAYEKDRCVD